MLLGMRGFVSRRSVVVSEYGVRMNKRVCREIVGITKGRNALFLTSQPLFVVAVGTTVIYSWIHQLLNIMTQ